MIYSMSHEIEHKQFSKKNQLSFILIKWEKTIHWLTIEIEMIIMKCK